jgi:TIR domain
MKIFISWSGVRSRTVAEALKSFLESVIPVAKPWVSTQSIAAGSVWYSELRKELGQSGFVLLCLTKGNLTAPWIAFEAGALGYFNGTPRICPYLLDVETSQLQQLGLPYTLFQAVPSTKHGTQRLVDSIVASLDESGRPASARTAKYFKAFWPELNKAINQANGLDEPPSESERLIAEITRQNRELLAELARVREALSLEGTKTGALYSLIKTTLEAQFGRAGQSVQEPQSEAGDPESR